jgi:hypothetical protein
MDRITGLEPELSNARVPMSVSYAERILQAIVADTGAYIRHSEGDCWDCAFCDSGFWGTPSSIQHSAECPIQQAKHLLNIAD